MNPLIRDAGSSSSLTTATNLQYYLSMSTTLQLVTTENQVKNSLVNFSKIRNSTAYRALTLIRQARYFVYDPQIGFGPGKFVGFAGMTHAKYEEAIKAQANGYSPRHFNGTQTRRAISVATFHRFISDNTLAAKLFAWASAAFGDEALKNVNQSKWRFLQI